MYFLWIAFFVLVFEPEITVLSNNFLKHCNIKGTLQWPGDVPCQLNTM